MSIHNLPKYTLGFLLLLIIGVYSCKPKQRIIQADSALEDKNSSDLFEDVLYKELKYSTFSSKLNMNISTGKKTLSSKGSLRIVNNEAIQLSIQPLFGIEMFRLYVEPDHIIILDRMNKRYVKETFEDIKGDNPIGFNFYTLQSLFTNSLFVPDKSSVLKQDYKKFKYAASQDNYILTGRDKKSDIDYSFFVNGNDQITLTDLYMASKDYSLQWSYNQFSLMSDLFFPFEMKIVATTQKRKLNTSITLSAITLNDPLTLETSIPASYTRVELKEVLKILVDKK
jgi:hypothetical protein